MPDQSNLNKCPKCNESINPDENICQKCGASVNQAFSELGNVKETIENLELRLERLEKLLETQKSTEIKTNKLQFKDESLICSNCNLSNISSNKFCIHCGIDLTASTTSVTTPIPESPQKEEIIQATNTAPVKKQNKLADINWINIITIVGAAALLLSMLFASFVVYNILGSVGRHIFTLFIGGILLVGSEYRRKTMGIYPQIIAGTGTSIIYATIFSMFAITNIIPPAIGLVFLALIGIGSWYLAIRHNGIWIAILGTAGVFITPNLLVFFGQNAVFESNAFPMLLGYLLIMDIAVVLISMKKNWDVFNQISILGSYIFIFASLPELSTESLLMKISALISVYVIFITLSFLLHFVRKEQPNFRNMLLINTNSILFYFGSFWVLWMDDYYIEFAILNLILAGLNFGLGIATSKIPGVSKNLGFLYYTKSAVFLTISIPIFLGGFVTTIAWSGMAAGFTIIGLKLQEWKWRIYSVILFVLVIIKLFGIDMVGSFEISQWPYMSWSITSLFVITSLWITYLAYKTPILNLNSSSETNNG